MRDKFASLSNNAQGIILTIIACFLVSAIVAIARHLSEKFDIFFIVMMRNVFSLLILLPMIIREFPQVFATKKLGLHTWRNVNGFISQCFWFYSVTIIPMSDAVAITFLVPILTIPAAMFFLKEKVKGKIFLSLILGFIGVLIIIRPGFNDTNLTNYGIALLTPAFWTLSNILIKKLTATESAKTIVVYMAIIMTIVSIPLGINHIKPLTAEDIAWLFLIGLMSNMLQMLISASFSKSDISLLQPFDYTRLVFTAIIAYFAFNEMITLWTIIGSAVILFGASLILPIKIGRRKQAKMISSERLPS